MVAMTVKWMSYVTCLINLKSLSTYLYIGVTNTTRLPVTYFIRTSMYTAAILKKMANVNVG